MNKLKPVKCGNCKYYISDIIYKSDGECLKDHTYTREFYVCNKLPTDDDRRDAKLILNN